MKMRRRALSVLLSLAVVFTFMPFVSSQAYAASSKQPLVTKAVDNDGYTHTYSYNKKGLVKKVVSKSSSSSNSSEYKTNATTTIKYNKKNKISSETTTSKNSSTSYKTDKTTGKKRVASKGTVTDIYKTVTKYTYNKKGLATKAVKTKTYTKSGSRTDTTNRLMLDNVQKLSDGSYRYYSYIYDEDGDWVGGEYKTITAAEAAAYAKTSTDTYAYKDNGNGTYTVTNTNSNPDLNDPTKTIKDQSVTTTSFKYKKKNVKTATSSTVETEETTTTYSDRVNVTTTVTTNSPTKVTYTYKKGRVSKEVNSNPNTYTKVSTSTTTYTDGNVYVTTTTSDAYGNSTTVVTKNGVEIDRDTITGTDKVYPITDTTTYKYDKNGNLKSASGKNTETSDYDLMDEVYDYDGDYDEINVVVFDAAKAYYVNVKTPVSTVYKWTTSLENTIKSGTKKILTSLGMTKSTTDGRASGNKGGYKMDRTKYTLKSKKVSSKASANVEAQQWMIQNGVFKVVGL